MTTTTTVQPRLDYKSIAPEDTRRCPVGDVCQTLRSGTGLLELVRLRASQLMAVPIASTCIPKMRARKARQSSVYMRLRPGVKRRFIPSANAPPGLDGSRDKSV